jgi:Na+/H+ antiporter NhaD/arsenite permease-like protein
MIKQINIKTCLSIFGIAALVILSLLSTRNAAASNVIPDDGVIEIVGRVLDTQGQPIEEAEIRASIPTENGDVIIAEGESNNDGTWSLTLELLPEELFIEIDRAHFHTVTLEVPEEEIQQLKQSRSLVFEEIEMERKVDAGFWAATAVFLMVLIIIATEKMHSTTASLTAMSSIFVISYIGGAISPDWYIYSFEQALGYINWEVIFLVMGMMIIIAVLERTGLFQWTAFQAYRLSGGKSWLLVLILMAVTAVASALLDNFTTMLLMTPISLQIGLALGINPIALIIPEIMASNVGGISTLIGTPTNIVIGAYADIGFNDFLANQTIGVILALLAMAGYVLWHYRDEWKKQSGSLSPKLYNLLKKNGQIKDKPMLIKSGITFIGVLAGFVLGEQLHIPPAVPALVGATVLFAWLRPDVKKTIEAVDWTTLVFFMSLFMVVGAVQEVGLISLIADLMKSVVQENLVLAIIVIVFGTGTLSTVIANIPLAVSMLPVVEFLSGSVPGASSKVLYYALSMGAAMGGNALVISGEANLVTAGITEQAGRVISFKEFMKVGLPATYITLAIGTGWLLLRFIVLGS